MKLNLLFLTAAALVNAATAIESAVELGTTGDYVILAKTGIDTVADSVITGDITVSPIATGAITGFKLVMHSSGTYSTDKSEQVTGVAKASNYDGSTPSDLTTAVSDMEAAYTDAAGRPNPDGNRINNNDGEIGGKTLTPGVYTFGTDINISDPETPVTFKGSDNADTEDIFIIQMSGSIVQAANTKVVLTKGAKAENIFWQVAEGVSVGAGAHLEGILLVKTAVTFVTGSSLNGRVLAQTACNVQMATITEPTSTDA
jgi:hypothetical protein